MKAGEHGSGILRQFTADNNYVIRCKAFYINTFETLIIYLKGERKL